MAESAAEATAEAEIGAIVDRLISYGEGPGELRGATDAEIDAVAAAQNASAVPAAVRAIMRAIGIQPGMFHIVGAFYLGALNSDWKSQVLEFLDEVPADRYPLEDTEHMLVIMDSQSAYAAVVDGAHLTDPDPPVWGIWENGDIVRYDSVTEFFRESAQGVQDLIDLVRKRQDALRRH
ncbi:hypothetical protein [Nocardia bovistercoris]|uniref:SMI1/KNR4 family protein n=1 Tax=Nocardia bovistercoris TaxID=2785916 RepID=A0A931I8V7_9NOCA|nr:hypothetical protein [Nocardia bovistercoris]MBH0776999.1 hypothetical protein [Nocardia bovistercoris]